MAAAPEFGRATAVETQAVPPEAAATQELYERHARSLLGYCLNQLGNREEAEDAVQTTFLNAFRGLKRGIVPEAESAWLFKIAQNVCLSRRRSAWRRGRVEFANDLETLQEVTAAPPRAGDELIRLPDVLAAMPATQRRAILLREWQGLSYREIAEVLELSQAAVETLLFRARRSLAQGLVQEPERPQKRVGAGASFGSLVAALKSLLVGGSVVKVAATAAVVAGASVVAGGPLERHFMHSIPKAAPKQHVAPAHHAPRRRRTRVAAVAPPTFQRVSLAVPAAQPAVKHPTRRTPAAHRQARVAHVIAKTPAPVAPVAATPAPAPAAPAPAAAPPAEQPKPDPAPAAANRKPEKKDSGSTKSSSKSAKNDHGRGASPGDGQQQSGDQGSSGGQHQDPAPTPQPPPAPSGSGGHDGSKLPPPPASGTHDSGGSHDNKSPSGDGHGNGGGQGNGGHDNSGGHDGHSGG